MEPVNTLLAQTMRIISFREKISFKVNLVVLLSVTQESFFKLSLIAFIVCIIETIPMYHLFCTCLRIQYVTNITNILYTETCEQMNSTVTIGHPVWIISTQFDNTLYKSRSVWDYLADTNLLDLYCQAGETTNGGSWVLWPIWGTVGTINSW